MRSVWRVTVALTVMALSLAVGPAAHGQDVPDGPPALTELARCVADTKRLSAVLLVDESISLQQTDRQNARVEALQAALIGLNSLAAADAVGAPPVVEVRLAGFAGDYSPEGDWTPLSTETIDEVRERAASFAGRNNGVDTDYVIALEGAQADLDRHAKDLAAADGTRTCTAIIWFTDGGYQIGQRDTAAEAREHGADKPYAPDADLRTAEGVEAATKAGRDRLCAPGGLVDELRGSEVYLVAIALQLAAGEGNDADGYLSAIAQGTGGEDIVCGEPEGATETGAYLRAADVGRLPPIFLSFVCSLGGCVSDPEPDVLPAGGDLPFLVDRAIGTIVVTLSAAQTTEVVLVDPSGATAPIPMGADAPIDLGPSQGEVSSLGDGGGLARVDLAPGVASQYGTWLVRNPGPIDVVVDHFLLPGIEPVVADDAVLQIGVEGEIPVSVVDRAGTPVPASDIDGELELEAVVLDPVTAEEREAAVTFGPDGTGVVAFTLPEGATTSSARVTLALGGTAAGDRPLSPIVRSFDVPVVSDPSLPRIVTTEVLPPLLSKGVEGRPDRTSTTVALTVRGSDNGAGQVCVTGAEVRSAPRRMGDVAADGGCVEVPQGREVELAVTLTPDEVKTGRASGAVVLDLSADRTGAEAASRVPFELVMERGVDAGVRRAVGLGIVLASVLVPILILGLWSWAFCGFRHVSGVQFAAVRVTIEDGVLRREGDNGRIAISGREWRYVGDGLGHGGRQAELIETPYVLRARPHLFALPTAVVVSPTGPVLGSEGFGRSLRRRRRIGSVPHSLYDSWALVLDAADPPEGDVITSGAGDLIVFIDDAPGWEQRLSDTLVAATLAGTGPHARTLATAAFRAAEDESGTDVESTVPTAPDPVGEPPTSSHPAADDL